MTKQEIVDILNNIRSFERKDFVYELLIEENFRGKLYSIVKYDLTNYIEYINDIASGSKGEELRLELTNDRFNKTSLIKRVNSFFSRSLQVDYMERRSNEEKIINELFKFFINDLSELSHRQLELITIKGEAINETR